MLKNPSDTAARFPRSQKGWCCNEQVCARRLTARRQLLRRLRSLKTLVKRWPLGTVHPDDVTTMTQRSRDHNGNLYLAYSISRSGKCWKSKLAPIFMYDYSQQSMLLMGSLRTRLKARSSQRFQLIVTNAILLQFIRSRDILAVMHGAKIESS